MLACFIVGLCRAAGLVSSPLLGFSAMYQPEKNQGQSALWKPLGHRVLETAINNPYFIFRMHAVNDEMQKDIHAG